MTRDARHMAAGGRVTFAIVLLVLLLASLGLPALAMNQGQIPLEIVPGPNMRIRQPGGGMTAVPAQAASGQVLLNVWPGVSEMQMSATIIGMNAKILDHKGGSNRYLISLPAGTTVMQGVATWKARPEVKTVSPNFVFHLMDADLSPALRALSSGPRVRPRATPNDPLYSQQWQWPNTNAPAAWDITQGSANITVAVVDSGVDRTHPDLAAKTWINKGEIPGNGIDDDGNGFVDDVFGWDFIDDDNDPRPTFTGNFIYDESTHGTHCAGLVGASANNGIGVVGYDWSCKIMAVRVFDNDGSTFANAVLDGFDYAVNNGANVISLSLGGPYTSLFDDSIQNAVTKGILVVAAAGNNSDVGNPYIFSDDQSTWLSPVCNDGPSFTDNWVLGVGAVGDDDTVAFYSDVDGSSHKFVDVMAPGGDSFFNRQVLSTVAPDPPSGHTLLYDVMQGTSMATPVTAGLAGLVRGRFPTLTPDQVVQRIRLTCDNIDAKNPSFVGLMGAGRINGGNAVADLAPKAPKTVSAYDTPGDQGGSVTVVWSKSADDGKGFNTVVGYDVMRSDTDATGPFVKQVSLPSGSTSYTDTNVINESPYWYYIVTRSATLSSNSKVAGPAVPRDDLAPDPITTLTAQDTPADQGGSITLYWNGYTVPADFDHYNVYRAPTTFKTIKDTGVTLLTTITSASQQYFLDKTVTNGIQYWYAVTAVDNVKDAVAPNGNENPNVTVAGPAVASPNFQFSFPPGVSMIAIGAQTTQTDMAALLGIAPTSLQLAWWDPALPGTDKYHRYLTNPLDPALQQTLGKAFWLSTADPVSVSVSGQPAPSGDFPAPFAPGWNMIGNPYTSDINVTGATVTVLGTSSTLADSARQGLTRDYMWGYDPFQRSYVLISPTIQGDFVSTTLPKGRGVFFLSTVSGSLVLPRPADAASASSAKKVSPADAVTVDWKIRLVAETPDAADTDNLVGVSARAQTLNSITSPPMQGVDLFFEDTSGVHSAAKFVEPGVTEIASTVKVASAKPGPVTLSWPDLSAMPTNLRPRLLDVTTGKSIYMRTVTRYTYQADDTGVREFKLDIKSADAGALAVQSLGAGGSRAGAQVVFTLSKDAVARVEVLNLAGRSIRTIADGATVAGKAATTLMWDGRSARGSQVPTGRYLVRITATTDDGEAVSATTPLNLTR